jgi:hypothetical protein
MYQSSGVVYCSVTFHFGGLIKDHTHIIVASFAFHIISDGLTVHRAVLSNISNKV